MKTYSRPTTEIGYVVESRDYLISIEGLPSARINDIIKGKNGERAIVLSLFETHLRAALITHSKAKPGDEFTKDEAGLVLPEARRLLGRILSPLGTFLDGEEEKPESNLPINLEPNVWGIGKRALITEQLVTGITLIDTLLPLGRGQRELLFGEQTSGKTPFVLDLITNQKRPGNPTSLTKDQVVCIYAAIGKSEIEVKRYVEQIRQHGALPYTIVIASFSAEPAPLIALTPSIALSLAENLRDQGYSSLVIFNDLGAQAKYLREIALLSERFPGRESYPGDIFHQQAHLTERAGNFMVDSIPHPVSITLLPLIESSTENFTSLIPTNIMATTDGHLMFSANIRSEGRYPSIEFDRSITRVGRQTQMPIFHELADRLRITITEYQELKTYSRFEAETVNAGIIRGDILSELLRQDQLEYIPLSSQAILLSLIYTSYFIGKEPTFVRKYRKDLIKLISTHPEFAKLAAAVPTLKLYTLVQALEQDPFLGLIRSLGR